MKMSFSPIRVLVTLETEDLAKKVAKELVELRLAACVQLKPITSFYEWEGETCVSDEIELSIKTDSRHLPQIITYINQASSYQITQILAIPIIDGDRAYLEWLQQVTTTSKNL